MNLRHFENKARQSWWLIHIEAWQRSGLDRTNYCRQHGLWKCTFDRWLEYLAGKEVGRKHAEYLQELRRQKRREEREKRLRKRQRLRHAVSTDVRNRAVQAFWAIHVEAMSWSGMGVREYAAALHLSPYSLRKWCDRFDDGEVEIDWRAHLHPSARPVVSTSASSAAKEMSVKSGLTDAPDADPPREERTNRRSFADEEKLAIVLETEEPGISVAEVCRRHGIVTSMLFRWRVQLGFAQKKRTKLALVAVIEEGTSASSMPAVLHDLLQPLDGMTAVELADGRRVFAPIGSDPEAVRREVAEREAALC
ncbi:transposase [Mesorhizobium sp. AR02]|uniref:IS66 family insertion sequence element accessory protein TnpA n=1 Tax=Mesorhizobium sp. AR02 TaxID=2865837 RepID=UPI002160B660|nr:transposase [Mesorhizobium sp. AR02]UVK52453.1 transposase [Mesorhizobium sp. AR02]